MRTEGKVTALSLALLVAACSKPPEPTVALSDDLKKDLAIASAPAPQLATAPQSYQRMRFVSEIERTHAAAPAPSAKVSRRHDHLTARQQAPVDPMISLASHTLAAVATPAAESPAAQPAIVVATLPAPPVVAQPGGPSEVIADEGRGSGLGGLIAGSVIRGGRASTDKCDPRTDGRARGIGARPDFAMPVPMSQPVFGGARRR